MQESTTLLKKRDPSLFSTGTTRNPLPLHFNRSGGFSSSCIFDQRILLIQRAFDDWLTNPLFSRLGSVAWRTVHVSSDLQF